jgi:transketolase
MNLSNKEILKIAEKAFNNRLTLLEIIKRCGSIHLGGCLSAIDILTVLYNKVLKHNPQNPKWEKRDIFILSAGHKAVGLYVVLESSGYFKRGLLWTFNKLHSRLPMHPDAKLLPGVEFSTGSLGHGLSVACGIAAAFKKDKLKRKIFVLMGDGESEEGSIWEAALVASKYKLDNLIVIIDSNGLQSEACVEDIMPILNIDKRIKSFGWSVSKINGHDISQIYDALIDAPYENDRPTCIVAKTIKAKGIDFAENKVEYHQWDPDSDEMIDQAIELLKKNYKKDLEEIW